MTTPSNALMSSCLSSPGVSLRDSWLMPDIPETDLHLYRTQILEQIAAAMAQLGQFSFRLGGRILFEHGRPAGIGSFRQKYDEREFEAGPFETSKDFYNRAMDRYPTCEFETVFEDGMGRLLRLFIDCITNCEAEHDSFVLTHPNFGLQNFIVSPKGDLVGVIGWGEFAVWPKSLGNRRYPTWLARDWNPSSPMHGLGDGCELSPGVEREDSSATLALCRKVYREAMHRISQEHGLGTSATVIVENIDIAANTPGFKLDILGKIVEEITTIVKLPDGIIFQDICVYLSAGILEAKVEAALRTGFMMLLRQESL